MLQQLRGQPTVLDKSNENRNNGAVKWMEGKVVPTTENERCGRCYRYQPIITKDWHTYNRQSERHGIFFSISAKENNIATSLQACNGDYMCVFLPRPASSTPATSLAPLATASRSCVRIASTEEEALALGAEPALTF